MWVRVWARERERRGLISSTRAAAVRGGECPAAMEARPSPVAGGGRKAEVGGMGWHCWLAGPVGPACVRGGVPFFFCFVLFFYFLFILFYFG